MTQVAPSAFEYDPLSQQRQERAEETSDEEEEKPKEKTISTDVQAQSVAQSLHRRGVRAEHLETMHPTLRQHYAKTHGFEDTNQEMWGAVHTHLGRQAQSQYQ
jgi:hypothetical protein